MAKRTAKHRYDKSVVEAPMRLLDKPIRYTPVGQPIRLRLRRHALLDRPEVADISVTVVPRWDQLNQLSEEERTSILSEAERLTARDFRLHSRTGELELDSDFFRQFFDIEERVDSDFQYAGGECFTHSASYGPLEDI